MLWAIITTNKAILCKMTINKDPLTRTERFAKCPRCGSTDKYEHGYRSFDKQFRRFKCRNCGRTYNEDSKPEEDRKLLKRKAIGMYLGYKNEFPLQSKAPYRPMIVEISDMLRISRQTFYTVLQKFKTELSKIDSTLTIENICSKKTAEEISEVLRLIF